MRKNFKYLKGYSITNYKFGSVEGKINIPATHLVSIN